MELKVVSTTANKVHACLGISEEREKELAKQLDAMFNRYAQRRCEYNTVEGMQEIAAISNTLEEYTYCMVNHFHWLSLVSGVSIGKMSDNYEKSGQSKN